MKKLFIRTLLLCAALASFLIFFSRGDKTKDVQPDARAASVAEASNAVPSTGKQAKARTSAETVSSTSNANAASAPGTGASPPMTSSEDRRPWDPEFLTQLQHRSEGETIRFELTGGEIATGVIQKIERRDGQVISVRGELSEPESGRFFFQKQTEPGLQGEFAGVVTLPASKRAYRIEPADAATGAGSELVKRPLKEVLCILPFDVEQSMEGEEIPPLDPSDHPDLPVPPYQDGIVSLQSLPGATGVLYIDYRGGYNENGWGSFPYERPNVSNAQIRDVWKRVAEDYIPFGINVTTDIKVYQAAPESSRQRCVVTPTTTAAPGAGGVAYLQSWDWTGDTPCWAFYSTGKSAAEVISHEVGHTLHLGHDGNSAEGYYGGQGSGAVGWAPIMGVGYYRAVTQWSKGEYNDANNRQDDLAVMVANNNNFGYRADDTGDTLATSRHLEVYSNNTVSAEGIIERTGDSDAFQFTTLGGMVSLRADPAPGEWANLALSVTLANAAGVVLSSNNPQSQLWASVSASLPAGTYTFKVSGAGRNNPVTDGFSSYASLGYYSITGSVANARQPSRFTIAENSPSGTVVGTIQAPGLGSDTLIYTVVAGNTGSAFALNNSGVLRVANAAALNYEALAQNTQFKVQYELFVNISNLTNPSRSETNRRVVVEILDVNEPPVMTGFTSYVLTGTQPGTELGTVTATDPDYFTLLRFSIAEGNMEGLFAIDPDTGVLSVAGQLLPQHLGSHNLTVRASDATESATVTVRLLVISNQTPFAPGSISYAVYDNIGNSMAVSDLTNHARFPTDPTWEQQRTQAESDLDRQQNFGSVLRGYVIPPISGTYFFFIASDDNSELLFSTTTNVVTANRIASVSGANGYTSPRQWNKLSTQRSVGLFLSAGQGYYIEARHKEGGGGDHVSIGWHGPASNYRTNVIPGMYLAPRFINYIPQSTGFTRNVRRDAYPGTRIGKIAVADANVADTHTYTLLSGNFENIFSVDEDGYIRVANAEALAMTARPSFTLSVRVADNGSPSLSSITSATLNITEAQEVTATAIQRQMFYDIGNSTTLGGLTSNPKFPGRPDALEPTLNGGFDTPEDVANDYGSKIAAYVVPPVSGDYRFFIASDDDSLLRFSRTTNPAQATVIASLSGWSDPHQWTKNASQISAPIIGLIAGQRYYIEALHKEGGGGDHLSVAWTIPGSGTTNVIPAANLLPVDINVAPQLPAQTFTILRAIPNNTRFGKIIATDSPLDSFAYTILSGNTGGTFALDPGTGWLSVTNNALIADGSVTTFKLAVGVQDSGYGGIYPLRTNSGIVTINVSGPGAPLVWTGAGDTDRWSEPANWGGGTPTTGSHLVFGQPRQQVNSNDAPVSLASVQFTAGGFASAGSPVVIQSGLTNSGANQWAVPTTIAGSQTWHHSGGGELHLSGPITNGGFLHTLVAGGDLRVSGRLAGTGSLQKRGTGRLILSGQHSFTGTLHVDSSGATTTALELQGSDDLAIPGATLNMSGRMDLWNHNATIGALSGSGTIFANSGSRTLTIGANNFNAAFNGTIQDRTWATGVTLGLTKTGTGTQFLNGNNTYSGPTIVQAGTLVVNGSIGSGTVTVKNGGTIAGLGSIGGGVNVEPGGILSPGSTGIGKLTILGDTTLSGITLMALNPLASICDSVVAPSIQYGGTLLVTNLITASPTAGQQFRIFFSPASSGEFAQTNLPPLNPGLGWEWSPAEGILRVVQVINPVPPKLTTTFSGSQLTLTWPEDRIGWMLQCQTNSAGAGVGGQWHDVPESIVTNEWVIPIDSANPSAFYRLRLQ